MPPPNLRGLKQQFIIIFHGSAVEWAQLGISLSGSLIQLWTVTGSGII
jgi:hypothetical protein